MEFRKKKFLFSFIIVINLIIAFSILYGEKKVDKVNGKNIEISKVDVKKIFNDVAKIELNSDSNYTAYNKRGAKLGEVILTRRYNIYNHGYGGDVPIIIGIDNNRIIQKVVMLKNNETPRFQKKIHQKNLFKNWENIELKVAINKSVDAISGATYTSEAVISAVSSLSASYFSVTKLNKEVSTKKIINNIVFFIILISSILVSLKQSLKKYRLLHLFFSIIILGFMLNKLLSLALFNTWITGNISWETNPQSIILFLVAISMPMFKRPRFYCSYICPMGALQEIIGKFSPAKKYKLSFLKFKYFPVKEIFFTCIWASLFIGFVTPIDNLEPFVFFSIHIASWLIIGFTAIIAILSIFFKRPWCAICPTGCLLQLLEIPIKTKKSKN